MNILHISSHYGGGVGTVVSAIINNDLENKHVLTHLNNVPMNKGLLFNESMVEENDIILCHVWNHPSMFEFLINTKLQPCRLVIWSHVSGRHAPDIYSAKLISYPDCFVFTTPVSYECREIMELPFEVKSNLDVVWSTYDIKSYNVNPRVKHEGFNVGYIGTASYGKLHHKFIEMCAAVKADVKFIIISNDSQEHLKQRAKAIGVYDRFDFKGKMNGAVSILPTIDIFGYPLQSAHFGSCEQVIGEAMSCGVVPVVLGNPTERYIVRHMETGMVVDGIDEYSKAIDYLYSNTEEFTRMSNNAGKEAKIRYDIKHTVKRWNNIFNKMMQIEKRERIWGYKLAPHFLFATSLGVYGKSFFDYVYSDLTGDSCCKAEATQKIKNLYHSNPVFFSESKGSIKQYFNYFPNDTYLREWFDLEQKIELGE